MSSCCLPDQTLDEGKACPFSSIVPFRTAGSAYPIFFLHGVTGDVERFATLVKQFGDDQPAYGIQAQGFDPAAEPLTTIEGLASYYLGEIARIQPSGPYHFVGFSFGGMLAFEMSRQLLARSETVGLLGMIDACDMSYLRQGWKTEPVTRRIGPTVRQMASRFKTAMTMQGKLKHLKNKCKTRSLRMFYGITAGRGKSIPRHLRSATDINYFAALNYQPKSYSGSVMLFKAEGQHWDERLPQDLGWRRLADEVEIFDIPGDHTTTFLEPSVSALAEYIRLCLRRIPQAASVLT